ncbi:uncharacterized protein [Emydura macquarii macquarii]|uniref:uncharacterized protein n=1 Tax=Emydura macquarii macquarii TaxID=1129001 RepID=UPI00352B33BC
MVKLPGDQGWAPGYRQQSESNIEDEPELEGSIVSRQAVCVVAQTAPYHGLVVYILVSANQWAPKHAPTWSRPEVLDLIGLWGEESVLVQLRASKRNLDIYGKISQGVLEKGHNRDAQQCRVKFKELRQAYQKARKANSRFGSWPKTCHFYEALHAILGGDPTPHVSIYLMNTLTIVPLCIVSFAVGNVALRVLPATPAEQLSQIRRRRKRTEDDMFQEILKASADLNTKHRAWSITLADSMARDRAERRKAQEKERDMQQEMLVLHKQQTDMLQTLVDLQVQQSHACLPLQPIVNCFLGPP